MSKIGKRPLFATRTFAPSAPNRDLVGAQHAVPDLPYVSRRRLTPTTAWPMFLREAKLNLQILWHRRIHANGLRK